MNSQQMAIATAWVGLDVDSKCVVAAVDGPAAPGGLRVRPCELPARSFERSREGTSQMLAWAASVAGAGTALRVVMESTGSYSEQVHGWLCEIAPQTGPAIMNPKVVKDFLTSLDPRTKSDRVDSQGIARFGTDRRPQATPPMTEARRQLRDLMRTRALMVQQRDALRNRLETTAAGKACRAILERAIKALAKEIDRALEKALMTARKDKQAAADLARLMEVFGVAEITALTVLAELGDLRRFESSAQLACYCGLTPRTEESGGKSRKPRMSKFGNANVRRALYMAAVVNVRHNKTDMAQWYQNATGKGMPPVKAMVSVMRKLLDRMYLMISTDRAYERHPEPKARKTVESV